jgi:hypothetical protein
VTISDDLDNTAAAEAARSVSNAHDLLRVLDAAATRFGVRNEQRLDRSAAADVAANIAVCARLKDLSIVPVKPDDDQSEKMIERHRTATVLAKARRIFPKTSKLLKPAAVARLDS